jgi:hypothetical protein
MCPGPGIASLGRCPAGPKQKYRKQPHAKIESTPVRGAVAALHRDSRRKGPIPRWRKRRNPRARCCRAERDHTGVFLPARDAFETRKPCLRAVAEFWAKALVEVWRRLGHDGPTRPHSAPDQSAGGGLTGRARPLYSAGFATSPSVTIAKCPCGGIGRRARLKIEFRKECWFDSGQGHHRLCGGRMGIRPSNAGFRLFTGECIHLSSGMMASRIAGTRRWFNATPAFQGPDSSRSAHSEACRLFRVSRSR